MVDRASRRTFSATIFASSSRLALGFRRVKCHKPPREVRGKPGINTIRAGKRLNGVHQKILQGAYLEEGWEKWVNACSERGKDVKMPAIVQ